MIINTEEELKQSADSLNLEYVADAVSCGHRIDYCGIQEAGEICSASMSVTLTTIEHERGSKKVYILVSDPDSSEWFTLKNLLASKKIDFSVMLTSAGSIRDLTLSDDKDLNKNDSESGASKSEQMLFQILDLSKERRASDIHVKIHNEECQIEFRIDGIMRHELYAQDKLGHAIGKAIFSSLGKRADNISSGDYAKNNKPLDATFYDNKNRRWRAALYPGDAGGTITIRELGKQAGEVASLTDLGFTPIQRAVIKKAISRSGLLLITGPTSSGKSTTLISIASMLNDGTRSIYSIEDPVEKILKGITQASADTAKKKPEILARQLLRQDPDVILYGELRDKEMVASAVRMSTTGHLSIGTFHTNGAVDCVMSLEGELGVSLHRLSNPGFLRASIYQELIGKVCEKCGEDFHVASKRMEKFDVERIGTFFAAHLDKLRFQSANGCEHCLGTGIYGKTAVADVVPIDMKACKFIAKRDFLGWKEHLYITRGWPSIKDHAIEKVKSGILDPFACESVLGSLTSSELEDFDLQEFERMAQYED